MPPTACESERGPQGDHQELNSSNEVRVLLLVNEQGNISQTPHQTRSPPSDDDSRYGQSTVSPTTARAREALAIDLEVRDFLVAKELATRAIPTRIFTHKSCGGAAPPRSAIKSWEIGVQARLQPWLSCSSKRQPSIKPWEIGVQTGLQTCMPCSGKRQRSTKPSEVGI